MFTPGMVWALLTAPVIRRNYKFCPSLLQQGAFLLLLLILCLPTHASSLLAKISLSRPVLIGTDQEVGSVTLNTTATTAQTVMLQSGDANVTVPTSVTIPAGQLSASFRIASNGNPAAPTYVTVSGSAGGWSQSVVVTHVASGYAVSIQNLGAAPGNGCVLLSWNDLADGTYQGYNIYKINGAAAVKLNATPQQAPLYAITGLTNGTSYQYKVSVVNTSGTESALSAPVSATPSAAIGKLSWINPPATASGTLLLYASMSSGTAIGNVLLIDGAVAGDGGAGDPNTNHGGQVETVVDTTNLANGVHTLQLIGYVGNNICAAPPQSIQVTNDFGGFRVDEVFQQDQGDLSTVQITVPSGTAQWTLQILNSANTVIRSWQGTSPSTSLSWDGRDGTGTVQADGDYVAQLTALDAQNNQKQTKKHIALVKGTPNALALIHKISKNANDDQTLANTIAAQLKVMQGNNPGFTYVVLPTTKCVSKKTILYIRHWMATTVTDFYLFGHGSPATPGMPPGASWGCAFFWSDTPSANTAVGRDAPKLPTLHLIVPSITAGRQYNFAMMDCCDSAGGDTNGNITTSVDQTWANAFNIGANQNFASTFFGWDGGIGVNTFDDGTPSNTLMWRQQFWIALAKGYEVYRAAQQATQNTPQPWSTVNPWDGPNSGGYLNYRAQIFGDLTTTLP